MRSALELVADKGYADATVAEIERAAGLSPGAGGLYRHFPSKEDLILAAVKEYRQEVMKWRAIVDDLRPSTPEEAFRIVPKLLSEFAGHQHPAILAFALEGLRFPAAARNEVQQAWEDGYRLCAAALRRIAGQNAQDVDFDAAAVQLFGGLAQFAMQTLAFGKPPLGVSRDRYVESWIQNWSLIIKGWKTVSTRPSQSP